MRRKVGRKRGFSPSFFGRITTSQATMKAFKTIGLGLVLGISVTACGAGSEKWKEEVKLSDGRVIIIERELILESGGGEWASNRRGVKPKENRIRFINPNKSGELIEWYSIKNSSQKWPEVPQILDITANNIIIFTSVFTPGGCNLYSKYVYLNGNWIEEKLPSEFVQHNTNLFIFSSRIKNDYINLKIKQKSNSDVKNQNLAHVGPTNPDCSYR